MLILLNQFDMIHKENIYENINSTLKFENILYILDTDDMVVESISYNNLYQYIRDEVINVENINYDEEEDDLYCSEMNYTFMDFLYDGFQTIDGNLRFDLNKKNKCNGVVTINNNSYELTVDTCYEGNYGYNADILLNGEFICTINTNEGLFFREEFYEKDEFPDSNLCSGYYGIPYIASLGNMYLIHFYIHSDERGYNLVLVIDKNGNMHDIFPLNGFEEYFFAFKFKPKSEVFRTKYKTVFKEKY